MYWKTESPLINLDTNKKMSSNERRQKRSCTDVCFNIVNTVTRVGLLYFPSQLAKTGCVGLLLFIPFALFLFLSFYACSRAATTSKKYSYLEIGKKTFGQTGKMFCFFFLFSYMLGCTLVLFSTTVLYLMHLINAVLPLSKELKYKQNSEIIITIVLFIVILIFSFVRNTFFLTKIAKSSFFIIIYIFIVFCLNFFFDRKQIAKNLINPRFNFLNFASLFQMLVSCLTNQPVYIEAIKDLKKPTNNRKNAVLFVCITTETFIYAIFSTVGYFLFGTVLVVCTPSDILSISSNSSTAGGKVLEINSSTVALLYQIAICLMFFSILATIPSLIGQIRKVVMNILPFNRKEEKIYCVLDYLVTVLICFFISISSFIFNIEKVDEFLQNISGISGSFLCFLLPALFFFQTEKPLKTRIFFDLFVFFVLFFAGILCLTCFFFWHISTI